MHIGQLLANLQPLALTSCSEKLRKVYLRIYHVIQTASTRIQQDHSPHRPIKIVSGM